MSTTNQTNTIPPEALDQVRCAFCLNPRADQAVTVGSNTAYLCFDCAGQMDEQRRYPKFTHSYNTDTQKVVETEIDPADQGQNVSVAQQQQQPPPS